MCCNNSTNTGDCTIENHQTINAILASYDSFEGNLIAILQKIQKQLGYLPKEALEYLSNRTQIKESKIYGVVTFYSQFRTKPIGDHLIMLCQGTACHVNGSKQIEETIRKTLNIQPGETTDDGVFTFSNVACLGCCSLAPVMMIDDRTYGNLTSEKTIEILEKIRSNALKEAN